MLRRINEFVLGLVARARSEEGQALGESSLILAFIFVVCVAALTAVGLAVSGQIQGFADAFP